MNLNAFAIIVAWSSAAFISLVWLISTIEQKTIPMSRAKFMIFGFLSFAGVNHCARALIGTGCYWWGSSTFTDNQTGFFITLPFALPFALLGCYLTMLRLRTLQAPFWLGVFAMIPYANLLLYVALSLQDTAYSSGLAKIIERSRSDKFGSALLAAVATAVIGILACVFSINVLGAYGWALFVFLPFALGTLACLLYGSTGPRTFLECELVMLFSVLLLGLLLLACAIEGIICIAMALPIALFLAGLGACLGYVIQARWHNATRSMVFCLPILLPAVFMVDAYSLPEPPLCKVSTSTIIKAPIGRVWRIITSNSELPRSKLLSLLGVNGPTCCLVDGHGRGAVRRLSYALGSTIVEPIEVWEEPHLLKFSVQAYPPVMKETSPYENLHPLHIDKHYRALSGQFELQEIPTGTKITATTWYTHNVWPIEYWTLWSDFLMHQIHNDTLGMIENKTSLVSERR